VLLIRKRGQVVPYSYTLQDPQQEEEPSLGEGLLLDFGPRSEGGSLRLGTQGPFDSDIVRLSYSNLRQPRVTLDYNLVTGACCFTTLGPGLQPPHLCLSPRDPGLQNPHLCLSPRDLLLQPLHLRLSRDYKLPVCARAVVILYCSLRLRVEGRCSLSLSLSLSLPLSLSLSLSLSVCVCVCVCVCACACTCAREGGRRRNRRAVQ
jgi:hypothetical protein